MNKPDRKRSEMSDLLEQQISTDEIIKRIRKLRWVGMDDEAKILQLQLKRIPAAGKAGALAGPYSTD
jgi:hypothetical protein